MHLKIYEGGRYSVKCSCHKTKNKKHTRTPVKHKETLGVVGYVYYLDGGEDMMGIRYVQTHLIVHIKKWSSLCLIKAQ